MSFMSCCAAGTNGCLDLRRRATALGGRVSAEWSRCPGSMAQRPRVSVAPLRRSSAGWMPARIGKLSAGVGRRHPVTIRKASLMDLVSEQKDRVLLLKLTYSSRLASLLLRWKTANTVFVVLSFSFQVWRYSPSVAMSLVSASSTACQSPSACVIARSSAYACFLETVVGRLYVWMLKSYRKSRLALVIAALWA